ncbi:hypothetical protein PQR57_38775 [Paraburkholderia dipogonis]|uniref:Polymer-forming cytoskeletal protein n=1 Tax=Paraburkholderia dipogonis TaxID=1211383 RepID=A0ABW9B258_9BURK
MHRSGINIRGEAAARVLGNLTVEGEIHAALMGETIGNQAKR